MANQLVNLFQEHDYESYIVVPGEVITANWMIKPAPTISIKEMVKLCDGNDIIIENWIDKNVLSTIQKLKCRTKVIYYQGVTSYKNGQLIGDDPIKYNLGYTHFWVVSEDSYRYLSKKYHDYPNMVSKRWYLVSPYFEHFIIASLRKETKKRQNAILCLSRKGKSYISFAKALLGNKIRFDLINRKFTEIEAYELMTKYKFFLSTAIGVSPQYIKNIGRSLIRGKTDFVKVINPYKEGFPLPPAEAALCGSIVIGFAMGGGTEWMSPNTCFLVKDRSYFSLVKRIKEALFASEEQLNVMGENAFKAVSKFTKENTWQQIEAFLNELS